MWALCWKGAVRKGALHHQYSSRWHAYFLLNSDLQDGAAKGARRSWPSASTPPIRKRKDYSELYLNEINLGQNSYGVGAAALNYFGKSLDELTVSEVAFLASLPKSPAHYDPRFHHEAALDRRNWVIGQMAENNFITDEQAKAARAEPLITQTRALGKPGRRRRLLCREVRQLLYKRNIGGSSLYDGGLQVRALRWIPGCKIHAVSALRTGLVRYDRRHGWRGAKMHVDVADWKKGLAQLASDPNHQSGIEAWRVAVALGYDGKNVQIGLADGTTGVIPYDGYKWANQQLPGADA